MLDRPEHDRQLVGVRRLEISVLVCLSLGELTRRADNSPLDT